MKVAPQIEITQEDNMELMSRYPDGYFSLAIVDPPYGINASEMTMGAGKKKWNKGKKWDSEIPSKEYYDELFRVSKNQIIWGGNYFELPIKRGWIFWDKDIREGLSFSDGELAWTSFDSVLKKVFIPYSGFRGADNGGKIHPTQKPVKLYEWLLMNYAKAGDKILDTHLGSGSIALAVHNCNEREGMNLTLTACELDNEYYEAALKRLENHTQQKTIFSL